MGSSGDLIVHRTKEPNVPIDAAEAVEIARAAGLGLVDVPALAGLARNRAHAVQLANEFAATTPPEIDYSSNTARHRSVAESISAKSAHLRRLHAAADHNGKITDTGATTPPPPPDAPDTQPATAPTPVEDLKPGALPYQPEPDLQTQIANAERTGDWAEAGRLKAEWHVALHDEGRKAAEDVAAAERRAAQQREIPHVAHAPTTEQHDDNQEGTPQ